MRNLGIPWKLILNLLVLAIYVAATPDTDLDDDGDIFRDAPNLRRDFTPSTGNPRITEHPQDDYFPKNEPASLNCKAEGDPAPDITWYKDGELVETNRNNPMSHRMLLDNGQLFFLRVIHSKNNQPDIGVYYCNATNEHGSAISRSANVQIAVLKDKFLEEPSDTTTAVGKSVTLHCDPPRGKPDPKVIWRKNGDPVQTDKRVHITDAGDLEIYIVEKNDIGEYLCVAINKGGEKQSAPARLQVLDIPVFNKLPKDVTVNEGQPAEFHCDVIGDPPIKVVWSKEGGSISFGRARVESDRRLRIEKVEPSDDGVYVCSAENAAGSTKATAKLTVYYKPSFVIKPKDQVVARGRTVSLQCIPTGFPHPTMFWRKESDKTLMFSNADSGHYHVAEDGTLRIQSVNDSDAGVYECEALNTLGAASAVARIQVVADSTFNLPASDSRPPPIIKLGPQNQTLPVNHKAILRCIAQGKPEPILRWYKNGRPLLTTDTRIKITDPGTLEISELRLLDSGTYTCKAVSETGETTWEAFLIVTNEGAGEPPVRSPAVAFLPDPPTKPSVSDVTDTTVHLSWAPGIQNTQFPVEKFYVEYFGYETTDGWVIASKDVKRESYTVERLRRNTTYMFLVRAVNSQGVGYPSLISEPVRTLALRPDISKGRLSEEEIKDRLNRNIVELMETVAVNSSSINISWMLPKPDNLIEGYQIEYRHILVMDVQNRQYGDSHTIRVPAGRTSHLVTGLRSYNWYELRVASYIGNILSWYSRPVKIQTEQIYKAGVPEDVSVHKRTDTSVSVLWSPPKTTSSMVTAYQVSCVSKDRRENCSKVTDGRTFTVTLDNLKPAREYVIKVAAHTKKGLGTWSAAFVFDGSSVHVSSDLGAMTTTKPLAEEDTDPDLFKKPWFVGLLIGVGGVMLWLLLCVFSIWLCKRKKQRKKMKDQRYYTGVPVEKKEDCGRSMLYPPQYGLKSTNINGTNDLDLPPELRVLLPGQQKKEAEIQEDNIYKMAGDGNFPELKTFYQKVDPVAPYATTALIQQQHLLKQRQQGVDHHMFRPINQGYIQHSEGSGDSCQKPPLSSDPEHSQHSHHSHSTTDHNHSDHMSPTSDSGSHSTDENNLLIKQKKRGNSKRDILTPKQQVNVNWSEMLPPPPEHPPPSECGEPPSYTDVRDIRSSTRSPMSPVSFSQLSACSCPNPHTQTPVSGWNMPVYSDNECPRCHSEKYYDPMSYCQEAFVRRTNSPRTQLVQNVNNRNIPNNSGASGHSCSPHGTPCGSVHYHYSHPHRGPQSNCATPQIGDNKSNTQHINRASHSSHSSHSDNEAQNSMPCFQSYRITPKGGPDPRFVQEEWGPDPAPPCHGCEHDSGMGMEEDGLCMGRVCPSSIPSQHNRALMSSSEQGGYDIRNCDSPTSEGADYAESDLDQSNDQTNSFTASVDQNTDCSSLQSSTGSSGDGTFQTEEDFASAVARAAELSGLTVVGTTICDPNLKSKKASRQRRPARPVSPGYSTDSNYGTIDMVRKPYPKSQRKQQLIEQGKAVPNNRSIHADIHERSIFTNPNEVSPYDTPFLRMDYPISFSNPATPLSPHRFSSLNRMSPLEGSTRHYDRGLHSAASDRGGYSSFLPHSIVTMPMKEDIV